MKPIAVLMMTGLMFLESSAWGHIFVRLLNIDDYLRLGKTILIVECVSSDDHPIYRNVFCRKARVVEVLRGDLKKEQNIYVLVDEDLAVGHTYLIYSSQNLEKGELNAYTYQPGTTEIVLWGEISRAEKERRIAEFLKKLNGLSLKDKLLYIFRQRRSDLDQESRMPLHEKELLDGLLAK